MDASQTESRAMDLFICLHNNGNKVRSSFLHPFLMKHPLTVSIQQLEIKSTLQIFILCQSVKVQSIQKKDSQIVLNSPMF